MRKSELFKKIFGIVYTTHLHLYENFKDETLHPEMNDEMTDRKANRDAYITAETMFDWYTHYYMESFSSSLTQVLSEFLNVENDVDLEKPDTIFRLTSDVQKEIEG